MGGLRQGGQAEGERQPGIVGERADVMDAGLAGALGQQQRSRSTARRSAAGSTGSRPRGPGRAAAARPCAGNSSSSPAWSHGRDTGRGRPAGQPGGLDQLQAGRRPAAALIAARQPGRSPRRPGSARWSAPRPAGRAAVSAAAISVTLCPAARRASTLARSSPVALRGPFGPGRGVGEQAQLARCAAAWPSGGRWRWSSRTGRRPRRRACPR